MKILMLLTALAALPTTAAPTTVAPATAAPATVAPANEFAGERLGEVAFTVSCAASVRVPFSRGVALLHDFWYEEAQRQFEQIAKADPDCAMAHWGIAMSVFHQIWDRPDEQTMARGWAEMQAAAAHPAKSARERAYVAALSGFYRPDQRDYQVARRGLRRSHVQAVP